MSMSLEQYTNIVNSSAEEFAATGLPIEQLFMFQVYKQNKMYDLPINSTPSLDNLGESPVQRMTGFMKTLQKEMDEGKEILALLEMREAHIPAEGNSIVDFLATRGITGMRGTNLAQTVILANHNGDLDNQILVMIADWLGDMNVYNRSEALKYGIPLESVLACIMGSNFTKLGADGMPIKDENGKVQKGPNFQPPEAAIYATMFDDGSLIAEACDIVEVASLIEAVTLPILKDPMLDVLMAAEALEDEDLDMEDYDSDEDEGHDNG
jgi:hypothetical protein